MTKQLRIRTIIAVVLVGIALLVHCRGGDDGWGQQALDAATLEELKPDHEADMRLLDHLRQLGALELSTWKELPEPGRSLFATLWVEEMHQLGSWTQMTEVDPAELKGPTLGEAAEAYEALGLPDSARAARRLATAFEREQRDGLAWMQAMREGRTPPRPQARETAAAAKAAFSRLDTIRARRLEFARSHAAELGIN